jgi:pimeloyl-ACP methyl ester carboxylesterase
MPSVIVNGWDLHYEERGAGEPILGIHGSPSSAVFWEEAAGVLAGVGRCVTYDRRGFHRSRGTPPPTLDLADHVADADALLTALGARPATVIGRSTGGLIALALAARRPTAVRALVLLEPAVFGLHPEALAWAGTVRDRVLAAGGRSSEDVARVVVDLAYGEGAWPALPAEVRDVFTSGAAATVAEVRGRGLDLSAAPYVPSADDLAAIGVPTLLLSGEESYPAARQVDERLAAALPDARHEVVAGGHVIDPAHPAVLAFLESLG